MSPPRERSPGRNILLASGGLLVVLAVLGHAWTRGDVGLGPFGGEYCNSLHCEDWSWERMRVAGSTEIVGYALVAVTAVLVLSILAFGVRRTARRGRWLRVVSTLGAGMATCFVVAFSTSFNHAPPFGWAIAMYAAGVVALWLAAGMVPPRLPEARVR